MSIIKIGDSMHNSDPEGNVIADGSLRLGGKTLLFLHIHKTAGTTLNRIIEREYNPFLIYTIEGKRIEWSLDHFKRLPEHRRAALRVVKGHMSFGLHEFLPRPSTYITFLRDPIERCISSYAYSKGNRFNPFHRRINQENLDLAQFLAIAPWNNNLQCKAIAGIDRRDYRPISFFREMQRPGAKGPDAGWDLWSTPEVLQRAKENLQRFFGFVGLTDRFTDSLVLLKHLFGWKLSSYSSYRKSRNRPNRETFTPELLAEVEGRNRFDRELYEFGKKMFDDLVRQLGIDLVQAAASLRNDGPRNQFDAMMQGGSLAWRAAASRLASLV
jgi:sulfotransferase famil protein